MGTRLGRYEIIRTLAKGSLTDLLLGRATGEAGFQRHVAIKQLREEHAADPACLEMFVNEARLAAALHHHNIVQVTDIGDENGQPYFAMEYVHGVDLRQLLGHLASRSEQLPIQHVVSIIASAAAALHHAHEQRGPDGQPLGIVHRQVTPANILVGFDGNVKIVDFGIAKAKIKRIQTGVGVLKGSAPYMAPEQCAGRTVDRRSDVFALGIVLYELSTVRRLFKGVNEFLTMSAVVNAEVPRPSQYRRDVPSELEVVMLKALARDPLARYQTAGDMANALDKVAHSVGVGASTTALANYMKLQFGDRREPWLETGGFDADPESTEVDFDGAASGLAPPPTEAVKNNAIPRMVAATKSSPISQARTSAVSPRNKRPSVAPPMDKSFHVPTAVDDVELEPASSRQTTVGDVDDEPSTDVMSAKPDTAPAAPSARTKLPAPGTVALKLPAAVAPPAGPPATIALKVSTPPAESATLGAGEAPPMKTAVATPPPPPNGVEVARPLKLTDATAIVEPLDAVVARATTVAGRKSRKLIYVGVGIAAVVAIVGAIALWPSSELEATSSGAPAVAKAEPEPEPEHEPTPPPPIEQKSALDMTARDYEAARADAAVAVEAADAALAVEETPDAAVVAVVEPPKPADAKDVDEVEPKPAAKPAAKTAKRTTKKTTATKRTPPVKKKTTTKKTKPKWNPDDLFLGE